jgi:hypothetical protein
MFKVSPEAYKKNNVVATTAGTLKTATALIRKLLKKRNRTTIANMIPINNESRALPIELLMKSP